MSDYIVLIVVSVGISACIFGIIAGFIKGDVDADVIFIKSHLKALWSALSTHGDEIDILRARVYDLENKLKEMEKLDDGK